MNKTFAKLLAVTGGWTVRVFVLAVVFTASLAVSCSKNDTTAKPADVDYYTCTMHPSVKAQDPKAKCPICSMDLVPVKKKTGP